VAERGQPGHSKICHAKGGGEGSQTGYDKVWQGRGSSETCDVTLFKKYRPNNVYRICDKIPTDSLDELD